MPMDLSRLYQPLTAMPLGRADGYNEVPPCPALKPWVRCYWGAFGTHAATATGKSTLVIPDTCVDLIFTLHLASGNVRASFCPMQSRPFHSRQRMSNETSLFAIRLYPWSVAAFAQVGASHTLNGSFNAAQHFPLLATAISQMLRETPEPHARIHRANEILQQLARPDRCNAAFMNAVYALLRSEGRLSISQLAQSVCISTRHLERLFDSAIGVSPKSLVTQIRYQLVWRDAATSARFSVLDAVERYGYTDQAHLLHQFRAYHSMSLSQALAYAWQHVAFLQDSAITG